MAFFQLQLHLQLVPLLTELELCAVLFFLYYLFITEGLKGATGPFTPLDILRSLSFSSLIWPYIVSTYLWSWSYPQSACLMNLSGNLNQLLLSQQNQFLCKLFTLLILLPWFTCTILKANLKQPFLLIHSSRDLFLPPPGFFTSLRSFRPSTKPFCSNVHCALHKLPSIINIQWRNIHWTRLDKCQGPPGSRGPKPDPNFLYILIFQVLGVSHLFYSTADFLWTSYVHQALITFDQVGWLVFGAQYQPIW